MTAKEYLQQVEEYDVFANGVKREIEEMQMRLESIHAVNYQKPRVQQCADYDRMTDQLSKIEEKQRYFEQCIADYVSFKQTVLNEIMQLKPNYFEVLRLYYLEHLNGKEIANKIFCTPENVYKTIRLARLDFYERFKDVHGFESAL